MKTEIEITTERDVSGSYSYSFRLNGQTFEDHDFTTREAALEEARSVAREALRK